MTHLIDGHHTNLSPVKLSFFAALFNARGAIVSANQLRAAAYRGKYKHEGLPDDRAIYVAIAQLRACLRPTRFRIISHRNMGWAMARATL